MRDSVFSCKNTTTVWGFWTKMKKLQRKKEGREGEKRAHTLTFKLQGVCIFYKVCLFFPEAITPTASCWTDVWRISTWSLFQLTGFSIGNLCSPLQTSNLTHQSVFTGIGECYCTCEKKKKSCIEPYAAPEGAERSLINCLIEITWGNIGWRLSLKMKIKQFGDV